MEIKYKRTYTPPRGKRYTMGEIQAMLGYAMEIADPRVKMKNGKLAPGEICMLLFALTPEEYALKDGDSRAVDELADKLLKAVPADRLLGWRIMDLKGAPLNKPLQPQTGESIDSGDFAQRMRRAAANAVQPGAIDRELLEARRLQKLCADKNAPDEARQSWQAAKRALGKALLGLNKAWVAYDALTGDKWPSIGFDGCVEMFTTRERADRVIGQIHASQGGLEIWKIREVSAPELEMLLRICASDGLEALRVDNGFAAAVLMLGDFRDDVPAPNAQLRSMILREIQYGVRWTKLKEIAAPEKNLRGALESMLTMRNFAWREIGNARLYALGADGNRDRCVVLGGPGGKEKLLAAFTTPERARTFAQNLKGVMKPVEMSFDELMQRCAACDGLLLDMGFIGYRLLKNDFEKVCDLRSKPPVVVRVQQEAAPAPAIRRTEDAGGLPDPDAFDVPARPETAETQGDAPANDTPPDTTPPDGGKRMGLIKKLFKK